MASLKITLPWPSGMLSVNNSNVCWAQRSRARKAYHRSCFVHAKDVDKLLGSRLLFNTEGRHAGKVTFTIDFYPPSRRHYDEDGCLSRIKAGIDQIAQQLGVDDHLFHFDCAVRESEGKPGRVEITIPLLEG